MPQTPFHLQYQLTRRQRLVPLLRMEGVFSSLLSATLFLFFCVQTVVAAFMLSGMGVVVFGVLTFLVFVLHGSLFGGLLEVLFVPVRNMDLVVEDEAIGILFGNERWYLFLDGILDLGKFHDDTWTIQHFNGIVLHIAAAAISEEQLAHIRAVMEQGRTPEGVRAVIERGKQLTDIMKSRGED